jgi:hypothetical protein
MPTNILKLVSGPVENLLLQTGQLRGLTRGRRSITLFTLPVERNATQALIPMGRPM